MVSKLAQFPELKRQLSEMLKTWLTNSDSTSWKTLTDALRSRSVGASQLASVLEAKYCLVEETEVDSATSICDTNITPPPPVSEQLLPQPGVADTQASKYTSTISPALVAMSLCYPPSIQVLPLTPPLSLVTPLLPRHLPIHNFQL